MKKRKWIATLSILAVFCATAFIYKQCQSENKAASMTQAPARNTRNVLNVNALVIRPQSLTDGITMVGSLLPDEEVNLTFETSGKIVGIYFNEGSMVKKGQLLAKVNDKTLQAQLSRHQAQLKLAKDRVYRQSALLEKDAVSKEAYEQAQTELATLEADIEIVRSNIALTELRAPFDGKIGIRNVSEGTYASPSVEIARLTKIRPLKIEMHVPERYADQVQKGTGLSFNVEGRTDTLQAEVYAKESKVDTETRTMLVRALYPNEDGSLQPGRFVTAHIRMQDIAGAIAIPTEAIVPEMGIDKVFLYRKGKATSVPVKTGLRTDALIHIVEGLEMGDTIITSGTLQLREGLPVKLDHVK
ncbi:MAG: efflux RND transporter periplasmic adaptor subunit [Flavobacteriales bacterium]|nr:efflux RND transporter periplasmic adaptor subunit [Flavobacteriales bacterium]